MARQLRIEYPGAFYHVTCRGNQRRRIFHSDDDRRKFLQILTESMRIYHVNLIAYVLMKSHFHLLAQTEKANLSAFMRRFNICYTGWFNYRHGTCGHLYQGRFKAIVVDADSYLLELSRYIHLNPVRVARSDQQVIEKNWSVLKEYRWSSFPGYVHKRQVVKFVEYDMILEMIGGRQTYKRFVLDGLRRGVRNPFENTKHQIILGPEDFVDQLKDRYIERGSFREQPAYRKLESRRTTPEQVLQQVIEVMKTDMGVLRTRERGGIVRGMAAEMLYRYCDLKLGEIGKILGAIDYCAVYQLRQRLKGVLKNNERLMRKFREIEKRIEKKC